MHKNFVFKVMLPCDFVGNATVVNTYQIIISVKKDEKVLLYNILYLLTNYLPIKFVYSRMQKIVYNVIATFVVRKEKSIIASCNDNLVINTKSSFISPL